MLNEKHLETVAKKLGLELPLVRRIVSAQFERTIQAIENKESVRIPHIGYFFYNNKMEEVTKSFVKEHKEKK